MKTLIAILIIVGIFFFICIVSLLVGFFLLKLKNEKRKNEYWKYVNK